jgi:hypothetical protein
MAPINAYHVQKTALLVLELQPIAPTALPHTHLTIQLMALVLVELVFI